MCWSTWAVNRHYGRHGATPENNDLGLLPPLQFVRMLSLQSPLAWNNTKMSHHASILPRCWRVDRKRRCRMTVFRGCKGHMSLVSKEWMALENWRGTWRLFHTHPTTMGTWNDSGNVPSRVLTIYYEATLHWVTGRPPRSTWSTLKLSRVSG